MEDGGNEGVAVTQAGPTTSVIAEGNAGARALPDIAPHSPWLLRARQALPWVVGLAITMGWDRAVWLNVSVYNSGQLESVERNGLYMFLYQLGTIWYLYPGHGDANAFGANPNTNEILASLGYKWLSVKYSYATSNHFIGWYSKTGGKTDGSGYLEANASYDLGGGWGVSGHVGHQTVKDFDPANYSDANVGITKDVGFGVVGLMYSHTNAKGKIGEPYSWPNNNFVSGVGSTSGFKNVAKDKAVLTFLKTF